MSVVYNCVVVGVNAFTEWFDDSAGCEVQDGDSVAWFS